MQVRALKWKGQLATQGGANRFFYEYQFGNAKSSSMAFKKRAASPPVQAR